MSDDTAASEHPQAGRSSHLARAAPNSRAHGDRGSHAGAWRWHEHRRLQRRARIYYMQRARVIGPSKILLQLGPAAPARAPRAAPPDAVTSKY
jgi:hypothetical protein